MPTDAYDSYRNPAFIHGGACGMVELPKSCHGTMGSAYLHEVNHGSGTDKSGERGAIEYS